MHRKLMNLVLVISMNQYEGILQSSASQLIVSQSVKEPQNLSQIAPFRTTFFGEAPQPSTISWDGSSMNLCSCKSYCSKHVVGEGPFP